MQPVTDTGHAPGSIIVAAGTQPRFYEFALAMERLIVPRGTVFMLERSCDIAQNFNKGVRKMQGEWAWFMGDDHDFAPDTLLRLLDHNVDVVIPPTLCKVMPFLPCVMHGNGNMKWDEEMIIYSWEELSKSGLLALPRGDFIGQAGMLVRKPVLDRVGDPWFKAGFLDPGRLQEDMTFCMQLQELGYTIWIDCDQVLDHYFIMGATAQFHNNVRIPVLINGQTYIGIPDTEHFKQRRPIQWESEQ